MSSSSKIEQEYLCEECSEDGIKSLEQLKRSNKEIKLIKTAIDYLLEAELLPENGWTEEDISILEELSEINFGIVKK